MVKDIKESELPAHENILCDVKREKLNCQAYNLYCNNELNFDVEIK